MATGLLEKSKEKERRLASRSCDSSGIRSGRLAESKGSVQRNVLRGQIRYLHTNDYSLKHTAFTYP